MTLGPLLVAAAGWLAFRLRLPRPAARPGAPPRPFPRVSIIVPARDEERNLPPLLASLAALDPAPAEIIVVDDGSRDGTARVAAAGGARVLAAPPPPPGWGGKPWACATGAAAATGELLLFTDADTVHAPASLGQAVAVLEERGAGVLSVVPSHEARAWWERLQGVFQLLLLVAAGRAFAIGQYLLFRRRTYDAIGGHAAARDRISEDLALTAAAGDHALLAGGDLVRVRMYPEGLGAFGRGWTRNFREGLFAAGAPGAMATLLAIGWLLGVPLHAALAAARGDASLGAALALAFAATVVEIARRQRLVGRFPPASALAYPLFTLIFVAISLRALAGALARRPVVWRGRSFVPARVSRRRW